MNAAMIPIYLDHRMKEKGHCGGYAMRVKHYAVQPTKSIYIRAYNEIFILLESATDLKIESELGIYDMSTDDLSEQQHEHSGQILITNLTNDVTCHVQFVQAIPLEPIPDCIPCND